MSETRGEGRSKAEKAARVFTTPAFRKRQREAKEREEREWQRRNGPIRTRPLQEE